MSKKIFLLLALVLFGFQPARAQALRAGAAKRIITPDPLLPVSGGIGTPKKTVERKGDLFVRAMVLEKGDTRVAFVSVDNLGWPSVLGDKSRTLVKGIKPENILIAATHTHSAPDAYGFPNEKGESIADLKYLDWCVQQIASAINEAVEKLEPATLKVTTGEAKGKIAYNYYAPRLYDPRCGVIQATSTRSGNTIATLVNYAVHPEVLGSNQGILSPDLCGPLYDRIEAKAGGVAMFINGAQGGMVTADVRLENGKEANTWEECHRIGELLADEALRIVSSAPRLQNPDLYCTSRRIEFPIESDMMKFILKKSSLDYRFDKPDTVSTQLNLVNIGPAQILTIPGEALPNIGYYLKRKMPTKHAFLFGLTNDAFGYMLTKVDFNSFERYEYVSRTSLGEMTGEIYIDKALELVDSSPKPE
ncbi:hypothetical protein [Persicitalea jodogahamensis]|uniref:Neutral/alkaline non-lysosomal ceramidase N-terminal domain-containing protein n=1 Tax=Persicitalea jodogahamensis TaxID=402147 RepID=A0A8J3D307_9BACT|nr:hypothetical protein [Persicitalea jodogahamensis]GHB62681.1 hypothetical protein GCM10007390_15650 [Persicitalea jodogahamensis]